MRSSRTPNDRVLIVDDEECLLQSLVTAAQVAGYDACGARDGTEALEEARRHAPGVVVTDLRMPGLDGPTLMGKLREEGMGAPVVVITGYATLDAAVECLREGAVDFLVKPFEIEEFLRSVARALSHRRAAGPNGPDWDALMVRFGLTRRETQILRAIYETGKSNRRLAEELTIALDTVKSHLKVAFQKMGVSNRVEMIKAVRELG